MYETQRESNENENTQKMRIKNLSLLYLVAHIHGVVLDHKRTLSAVNRRRFAKERVPTEFLVHGHGEVVIRSLALATLIIQQREDSGEFFLCLNQCETRAVVVKVDPRPLDPLAL